MRILIDYCEPGRDEKIAKAFAAGAAIHGDDAVARLEDRLWPADLAEYDVAFLSNIELRYRMDAYQAAGLDTVYFDKGYVRHKLRGTGMCEYWRVAVNGHHPTRYLMDIDAPGDRFGRLGIRLKPWRRYGNLIVLAGSSGYYHEFNGLPSPTPYYQQIVEEIAMISNKKIVYRPKPTWADAEPVYGADYSRKPQTLDYLLSRAHVLVTDGSNASFDAVVRGIPCLVLGEAVARPISSTSLEEVEGPLMASPQLRRQWLFNLAYCQWTLSELASGEAWPHIKKQILADRALRGKGPT